MASKLCPHILVNTSDAIQMMEAGSPLIKLVGDFGLVPEITARLPKAIILGRLHEGGEHDATAAYRQGQTYQEAARRLIERQKGQYAANPLIKIWEGPNEQVFGGGDDPENIKAIAWYGNFEAERLRLLTEMGLRGCVGNFATGNPDLPERDRMAMWRAFLPAIQAAKQYNGYLGLHEYSSPWMWYHTGMFQRPSHPTYNNPGISAGNAGWLTLRYRMVYEQLLIPQGLGDVPLILTEFGLDRAGHQPDGVPSGAWKGLVDYWKSWDGLSDPIDYWRRPERDPERYYAEQLIWIDREMAKDPYVVGATIFTVGSFSGTAWQDFDIAGTRVVGFLCEWIRSQASVPNPTLGTTPTATAAKAAPADNAKYVADVTIPDGTRMPPGSSFVKTWRIRNTGTQAWNENYGLVFLSGERMNAPTKVNVKGTVPPGGEVEVSVPMTAPATPGPYVGRYRMQNPMGEDFGFGGLPITIEMVVAAPAAVNVVPSTGGVATVATDRNLLINSNFEDGSYYADGTKEQEVPSGWTMWYQTSAAERLPGQDDKWLRPLTLILDRNAVAPSERSLYFASRDRSWKVSAAAGPTWVSLAQGINGLKVGSRYRFTAQILPDLAASLVPQKTYPLDPVASEVRLVADCGGHTYDTGWKDAAQVPYGRLTKLQLEFAAGARTAKAKVEVRTRKRVASGGWILDMLALEPA